MADKDRLVGTGEAARAMGIHPRTLQRYVQDGLVTPDVILPRPRRPQYRWNIRKLREQIKAIATRDDWNPDLGAERADDCQSDRHAPSGDQAPDGEEPG